VFGWRACRCWEVGVMGWLGWDGKGLVGTPFPAAGLCAATGAVPRRTVVWMGRASGHKRGVEPLHCLLQCS